MDTMIKKYVKRKRFGKRVHLYFRDDELKTIELIRKKADVSLRAACGMFLSFIPYGAPNFIIKNPKNLADKIMKAKFRVH